MGTTTRVSSIAIGVALLVGAPATYQLTQPSPSAGTVPSPAIERPETPSSTSNDDGSPPVTGTTAVRSAIDQQRWPEQIEIASVGARARIVPVGIDANGDMEVPDGADTAGWYQRGVVPGEAGSAIIAAHVDTRRFGRGAFFRLDRVEPGDEVAVIDAAGRRAVWVVTGRERYAKDSVPRELLYARSGTPVLVLVTCGGRFNSTTGAYEDNVIVYAEPAHPAAITPE